MVTFLPNKSSNCLYLIMMLLKKFKIWMLTTALVFISFIAVAQQKYTISGYVKDANNGEEQIGATVYFKDLEVGTSTNVYGFYSLTVPEGSHELMIAFIGYKTINQTIVLDKDIKMNVGVGNGGYRYRCRSRNDRS